ncbi:MAG: Aminomethyltransferase of Glycine cleavage system [Pseudomonadota bacterium]
MTAAKTTPLHATHRALGARMVDFAGWDMPVNYGSQIEEHHTVRQAAGMFDVSHMLCVDITGPDAQAFLLKLLANNITKLTTPGRALYSCMLREDGGVIDDLIAYFWQPTDYRLVVNAGTAEKDIAWMRERSQGFTVTLTPRRDLSMIAVQGPKARECVWQALPNTQAATENLKPFAAARMGEMTLARTGYTGEDGFEIMLPGEEAAKTWEALLAAGVKPAGLGARDTLRLEAGMNLYGQDMDETITPLESGLAWTVDLKAERDFIGKLALLSQDVKQRVVGLLLQDRGVLRGHQKVITAYGEGEITSGTFSPTLEKSIALARVPLAVAPGQTVEVEIRDKRLKALVVAPPFARNGKPLIQI